MLVRSSTKSLTVLSNTPVCLQGIRTFTNNCPGCSLFCQSLSIQPLQMFSTQIWNICFQYFDITFCLKHIISCTSASIFVSQR